MPYCRDMHLCDDKHAHDIELAQLHGYMQAIEDIAFRIEAEVGPQSQTASSITAAQLNDLSIIISVLDDCRIAAAQKLGCVQLVNHPLWIN